VLEAKAFSDIKVPLQWSVR